MREETGIPYDLAYRLISDIYLNKIYFYQLTASEINLLKKWNYGCWWSYCKTLLITNFLKSISELFFLMSINLKASSPTKYRKCGVSDVTHFKIVLATSIGDEPLSNLGLKPTILFRINSEYGELELE